MKYFKKLISLILVLVIVCTTCLGFSSCSKESAAFSVGDYLIALVDEFGMYLGTDELTDELAVETAEKWKILDSTVVNTRENVQKGFVLVTLVKTVGFYDTENMSEIEVADYAAENNYNAFSYKGEKDFNKNASKEETLESIQKAKTIWENPNFEEKADIEFADDVADLSSYSFDENETSNLEGSVDGITQNSSDDLLAEESDTIEEANRDVVVINGEVDVKKGQTYVSPTIGTNAANEIYVADEVEYRDGKTYIKNSDKEIDIEELLETAAFSGSEIDDLTTVPIVDGDGNVYYPDGRNMTNASSTSVTPIISNMSYTGESVTPDYLGGVNDKDVLNTTPTDFTMKFGDLTASISVGSNSFKCKVSGDVTPQNIKDKFGEDSGKKVTVNVDKSIEVKDISCDYNVNMLKKSAYVVVSGTQVDKTGATIKAVGEKDFKIKDTEVKDLPQEASAVITKTLAKIPIKSVVGVASICLLVKAKISISGSVEFVVTTQSTYGCEIKNGNFRYIKDVNRDNDVNINAKAEATAYLGPAIFIGNTNVISIGFEGGLGAEYTMTLHVYDKNTNEQLYYQEVGLNVSEFGYSTESVTTLGVDMCQDINAYGILKGSLDTESWFVEKLKLSWSCEFLGKSNASFVDKHIEDGKDVGECTRKYGRESTTEESTTLNNSNSIETEDFSLTVNKGGSGKIIITALPNGYANSDLVFKSDDTSVATVTADGVVTGQNSGSTTITISTKDNKFSTKYAISVTELASLRVLTESTGGFYSI